jgi:hypothetical protein
LKFDRSDAGEEWGQYAMGTPRDTRQEHGYEPVAGLADTPLDGDAHFFVLPRTNSARANEDDRGTRFGQGFLDHRLPLVPGRDVPLVEPGFDGAGAEAMRDLGDRGFVNAVVTEKYGVLGHRSSLP